MMDNTVYIEIKGLVGNYVLRKAATQIKIAESQELSGWKMFNTVEAKIRFPSDVDQRYINFVVWAIVKVVKFVYWAIRVNYVHK